MTTATAATATSAEAAAITAAASATATTATATAESTATTAATESTATAEAATTTATEATAFFTFAAIFVLHNGRRTFFKLFDFHSQITQHIFVDAHATFILNNRRRRAVEIEQQVVTLAVFLDAKIQGAKAPILALCDFDAAVCQDLCARSQRFRIKPLLFTPFGLSRLVADNRRPT